MTGAINIAKEPLADSHLVPNDERRTGNRNLSMSIGVALYPIGAFMDPAALLGPRRGNLRQEIVLVASLTGGFAVTRAGKLTRTATAERT